MITMYSDNSDHAKFTKNVRYRIEKCVCACVPCVRIAYLYVYIYTSYKYLGALHVDY